LPIPETPYVLVFWLSHILTIIKEIPANRCGAIVKVVAPNRPRWSMIEALMIYPRRMKKIAFPNPILGAIRVIDKI